MSEMIAHYLGDGVRNEVAALRKENDRLRMALRRIHSLAEKNVVKYAQQIAIEALTKGVGE
jgi:hypothetical protein